MATRRNVLVTGATGKQGTALIHSLLADNGAGYHVLALTRDTSSTHARLLLQKEHDHADQITMTEGNLDDAASMRAVFETYQSLGGIWGVYAVLQYPGLGQDAAAEEKQGKLLAELSQKFGVSVFIYSSTIPPGTGDNDTYDRSHIAKREIELYCEELGAKGLNWIIVRPGFFMENFDGFLGSIAVTIFLEGLKKDTTIALIASEDIGNVAAGVLKDHTKYMHKILTLTSGCVSMAEILESFERATQKPMPRVPAVLGKVLLKINAATQSVVKEIERNHEMRASGQKPSFAAEVALAESVCPMQTYFEWKSKARPSSPGNRNWNQSSLLKLLTGRS